MEVAKIEFIHPQTYCLLKGKQDPTYYKTLAHRIREAERIIGEVAKYFNMEAKDLLKKDRSKPYIIPRQVATYLVKIRTKLSDGEIAKIIKRDRTTVIHTMNLINGLISTEQQDIQLEHIYNLKRII